MTKLTSKQVEEALAVSNEIEFPIEYDDEMSIQLAVQALNDADLTDIYYNDLSDGGDYWRQVEYYSTKLHKSIILDSDARDSFEDIIAKSLTN
jgi:hypothetical protein